MRLSLAAPRLSVARGEELSGRYWTRETSASFRTAREPQRHEAAADSLCERGAFRKIEPNQPGHGLPFVGREFAHAQDPVATVRAQPSDELL